MAIDSIEAFEILNGEYKVNLYDARFARPVDLDLIRSLITRRIPIATVEDHGLEGGFGSCVVDAASDAGLDTSRIVRLGIPSRWIYQGSRAEQLEDAGIDAASIARTVRTLLDATDGPPVVTTVSAREHVASQVPAGDRK